MSRNIRLGVTHSRGRKSGRARLLRLRPRRLQDFPGSQQPPTAASGRSFGPREPPSTLRPLLQRRLWRSQAPAAAAVLRAARCRHGRPRAGAGVHDPRPAGVGQVGPRVVASLETPGLLSPRRGLWAVLASLWQLARARVTHVPGCPGSGCYARSRGSAHASCCFLLALEKGLLWSFYHTRLLLENLPWVLLFGGCCRN